MPYADKKKERETQKKYRQTHKEEMVEKARKFYQAHKEQERDGSRKYYHAHRKEISEKKRAYRRAHGVQRRDYRRVHVLTTHGLNGKETSIDGLNKRPYPNYCEICGILKTEHLSYHHWNNEKLSLGIWVCFKCHGLIEAIDKHGNNLQKMIGRYLKLKETLNMVLMLAR